MQNTFKDMLLPTGETGMPTVAGKTTASFLILFFLKAKSFEHHELLKSFPLRADVKTIPAKFTNADALL